MKSIFSNALILLALAVVGGCATLSDLDEDERAIIAERAAERWEAINAGDFEKAWSYSTPSFREVFPKHLYHMNFSQTVLNRLTGVEVTSYDARAAVASVAVRVMAEPTKYSSAAAKAVGAIPDTIEESWVFVDGEWWYIDRTRRM
jgi:hypothetical protein